MFAERCLECPHIWTVEPLIKRIGTKSPSPEETIQGTSPKTGTKIVLLIFLIIMWQNGAHKAMSFEGRRNWLKARESFHCRDSIYPSWSKNSGPFLIGYQLIIVESAGKVLPEWPTLLLHLRFSSSLHRCLPYRPHAKESSRFWLAPDCSGNEEIEREFFVFSWARKKEKQIQRNRTPDLRNPHSDALPVSHREVDGKMGCY